jgi:uncharacterized protein YebE (UPF0316 family)
MMFGGLGVARYDVRMLARLSAVSILSAASVAYMEILLWRSHSLLSLFLPFLVYVLACWRAFPKRTATRKAFSAGVFVGMTVGTVLALGYA